jgi:ADP-ribose pyrophosphatase YjhB (NUDIX family)
MNWSQKIYFNDKPLILTTNKAAYVAAHATAADYIAFGGAVTEHFELALNYLESEMPGVIIEDTDADTIMNQLHSMYHAIDAAGGVAANEEGAILMIYRRGKWDLPKGKRDEGESMEECGIREVKEETGLKTLALGDKVCDTYHIYSQYGETMLKRTAWYKMQGTIKDKLRPQKAENILEARWVRQQDMGPLVAKTYEAIKEVLQLAGLHW